MPGLFKAPEFNTWVPTVTPNGSLVLTPSVHAGNHARVSKVGAIVFVSYSQVFAVTGIGNQVDFSLPYPSRNARGVFSADLINVAGRAIMGDSSSVVSLLRSDSADFTVSTFHFSFHGFYEAA